MSVAVAAAPDVPVPGYGQLPDVPRSEFCDDPNTSVFYAALEALVKTHFPAAKFYWLNHALVSSSEGACYLVDLAEIWLSDSVCVNAHSVHYGRCATTGAPIAVFNVADYGRDGDGNEGHVYCVADFPRFGITVDGLGALPLCCAESHAAHCTDSTDEFIAHMRTQLAI